MHQQTELPLQPDPTAEEKRLEELARHFKARAQELAWHYYWHYRTATQGWNRSYFKRMSILYSDICKSIPNHINDQRNENLQSPIY